MVELCLHTFYYSHWSRFVTLDVLTQGYKAGTVIRSAIFPVHFEAQNYLAYNTIGCVACIRRYCIYLCWIFFHQVPYR